MSMSRSVARIVAVAFLCTIATRSAPARAADPAPTLPSVTVDAAGRLYARSLPNRTRFVVNVRAGVDFDTATIAYWEPRGETCEHPTPRKKDASIDDYARLPGVAFAIGSAGPPDDKAAAVRVIPVELPALRFATRHCLVLQLERRWTSDQLVAVVDDVYAREVGNDAVTTKVIAARIRAHFPGVEQLELVQNNATTSSTSLSAAIEGLITAAKHGPFEKSRRALADGVKTLQQEISFDDDAQSSAAAWRAAFSKERALVDGLATALTAYRAARRAVPSGDLVEDPPKAPSDALNRLGATADDTATAMKALLNAACVGAKKAPECDALDSAHGHADTVATTVFAQSARWSAFQTAREAFKADAQSAFSGLRIVATTPVQALTDTPAYTDRAPFYISADLGFVVPLFFKSDHATSPGADLAPYVGISFSFVPVDKDVPLAQEGRFFQRFSLVGGMTLSEVKDPSGSARGAIDGKGVVAGAGFRVTDYLRFGAGALFVKQDSDNPLVHRQTLRATPYLSASIDADVVGFVRGLLSKAQ